MPSKNLILLIDDEEINRKILKNILSSEYSILEAENGKRGLELLESYVKEVSAVMLDLSMPVMNGYQFLEVIRKNKNFSNIPIIVTTGSDNSENEIMALEKGAWDYVIKPYNPKIIKFRLKNCIDRSQLSAFNQLKYLSEYDTLTGIYNKTKFFNITSRLLRLNPDEKFVFIRFDVDRFQLINSFFGVEEGDKLLKFIAKSISEKRKVVSKFTFGRMESDIFCACMTYDKEILERMLAYTRQLLIEYNSNYDIVPSFGIYIIDDNTLPIDTIYDRATLAAKNSKGNYVEYYSFYDEDMSHKIAVEQDITNEMKHALETEQFHVYLQPKYNIQTNKPCGAEALVRWKHPEKGIISPGDFIPIFERNGFICKLDYYVWEKVCQILRRWMDEGKQLYPISVNISRVNLYNPMLVEIILELVEKYKIPSHLLNLELTESAYADNPKAMCDTMTRLQKHGFIIMMDDFGSGYSSLNVLKDIAVDVLKIDMRFLEKTEIEGRGENIIASVVRMAKWLDIPVIAEGAERKVQVEFLRSIGCEYVQGYYFAKPMPVDEYEALMDGVQCDNSSQKGEESAFNMNDLWVSNPQMEMLFSNVLQAVAIFEFEGEKIELVRVNKAFYELVGEEDKALRSDDPIQFIGTEYRRTLINSFKIAVETQGVAECEYLRFLVNGNTIWIKIKLKYINKVGCKSLLFGSLTDITTQKEIDSELQRYRKAILKKDNSVPHMLIIDDSEVNRSVLAEIFKNKFHVHEAEDGEDAISILGKLNNQMDIILLDLKMPHMSGKQFLKYRKMIPDLATIPIVIITADDNPQEQINALTLGANDYIVKPFVAEVVFQRINNVLESANRFRELVREYDQAIYSAQTDALTGLWNQSAAEHYATKMLNEGKNAKYAMIIMDLDNFKVMNDVYGRSYGDEILCKVALLLRQFFRQGDIISRINGDEFTIFMENISSTEVIISKCYEVCNEVSNLHVHRDKIPIYCSMGIAISSEEANTYDLLYKNAESALYEAKSRGKNQCCIHQKGAMTSVVGQWVNKEWIIDALDDAVYICDYDTYEMLYISKAGLKFCQIDEYSGKKCYEVLHGRSSPCPFCVHDKLTYEEYYRWVHKSKYLGKSLILKDKLIQWNGRKAHLQMSVDVTSMIEGIGKLELE